MQKLRCSLHHAGSRKICCNAVTWMNPSMAMGEEHASLKPSRPNSGTYKGITQPSLVKPIWAAPVLPHCTGATRIVPHIFPVLEDVYFLRKIFPLSKSAEWPLMRTPPSCTYKVCWCSTRAHTVQSSLLVSHSKTDPALQHTVVVYNNLQSPLCLQC